jgi:hypothetical protein
MKNALILCNTLFSALFGAGVALSHQTLHPLALMFIPLIFLTGFILIEDL